MNIIDRFVVRTYLSSFLILILVGMGMYILGDLLFNFDEFTKDRSLTTMQVLAAMVDYYQYNIPLYYKQLAGPMMSIAVAFTLGLMLKNNELTALVAAGVPLQRLVVPLAATSVLLLGVWVANSELVIPQIAAKIARRHGDVIGQSAIGVNCVRDDNKAILTALQLYPREGRLYHVYIIEPDANGRPLNLITADSAQWDADRRTWVLDERGRRLRFDEREAGTAPRKPEAVSEFAFGLSPEEMQLQQESEYADMLSLPQMNALLKAQARPNLPAIKLARHTRLTQPLLQLILLALAAPFFLSRAPVNVLAAGGRAVLVGGLFFATVFVAHTIISVEWTALVTWLPILVFGPVAAQLLANVKT